MMLLSKLVVSSALSLIRLPAASLNEDALQLARRDAPLKAFGILKNSDGFGGEPILHDTEQVAWAPDSQRHSKNATTEMIQDRSLELNRRQSCDTGYWYCSAFGRCCPRSQLCCSYGYCIDPEKTCCSGGPCDSGYTCCGADSCAPIGGDCCSNGNYCEPGNICVRLYDSNRIVCCTDLSCTAAVVSGTTTYARTTTQAQIPPVVTPPPTTTDVVVDQYETWYYTVTWWYLSFYWTTYQVQSTVTYTTIYVTTTYTTLATDQDDASSRFAVLSQSLTFEAPASATSLRSLYDSPTTDTEDATLVASVANTQIPSTRVRSSSSSLTMPTSMIGGTNGPSGNGGGASAASSFVVGWSFVAGAMLSAILMLVL